MTNSEEQTERSAEQRKKPFIVDDRIRKMIAGAVAEVDLAQIAVLRTMTPGERFAQMLSMMRFTEAAAADRLCQYDPNLTPHAALKIVCSGAMMQWLVDRRRQKQHVTA